MDKCTHEQRKFLHGVIIPKIMDATGHTNFKQVKEYIKKEYLPEGKTSTEQLTFPEYKQFLTDCIKLVYDCGGFLETKDYDQFIDMWEAVK